MLIITVLIGALVGWVVNWAADVLPRFAADEPVINSTTPHPPALWQLLRSVVPRDQWFNLRLGAELFSGLAFAYFWLRMGLSWDWLAHAGVFTFFLLIALIDLKYRLVLNVIIYPATLMVLLVQFFILRQNVLSVALGGGMTFAIFAATAMLRPGDLGGGDIKLATLIGFTFGFPQVLWALIVGGGVGAACAIYLLLRHRGAKLTMPYAPFLCMGAMVAFLYSPILFPM